MLHAENNRGYLYGYPLAFIEYCFELFCSAENVTGDEQAAVAVAIAALLVAAADYLHEFPSLFR